MSGSILIVDDEKGQRDILTAILQKQGYATAAVPGAREALAKLADKEFDLILTDLKMQGMSGMELMETLLTDNNRQCVVMMTAHGTIDSAVEAMKKGAFDYLEKPLEREDLLLTVKRAFEHIGLLHENAVLHRKLKETMAISNMIGEHPKIKEVARIIGKIAPTSSTVLIYGESGTGKELVAKAVHDAAHAGINHFLPSTAPPFPTPSLKANFSAMKKAPLPALPAVKSVCWRLPKGAPYFSTKSAR